MCIYECVGVYANVSVCCLGMYGCVCVFVCAPCVQVFVQVGVFAFVYVCACMCSRTCVSCICLFRNLHFYVLLSA